jgi:hypothetical protein
MYVRAVNIYVVLCNFKKSVFSGLIFTQSLIDGQFLGKGTDGHCVREAELKKEAEAGDSCRLVAAVSTGLI